MLAKKLGWQVYDHEILQYMASHQAVLQELNTLISPSIKEIGSLKGICNKEHIEKIVKEIT